MEIIREGANILCQILWIDMLFYAPNFEEIEEAYWFGPVHPSVCYTCTWSRTVRDRILKFGMWDEYEN